MNTYQYQKMLIHLQRDHDRMIAEMMQRPFGDRVMSDQRESELDAVECALLENPPLVEEDGELVPAGKGLLDDPGDLVEGDPQSIKVISQSEWPSYIDGRGGEDQLTIEEYIDFTLNQKSVGSCASEGATGCVMATRSINGQEYVKLNPYFIYHTTSGGSDRGSTLSETVRFLRERGVASQDVWPRSQGWRRRPSSEAYEDAKKYRQLKVQRVQSWDEFGTMLLQPFPVYFGYPGHAIFGSRLLSPTRFRYKNSWGSSWGDNGYGTLSNSRIQWSYGVYVFTSVVRS